MSETEIARMLPSKASSLLNHLKPLLDENRSLRLSLFLLLVFTLSVLVLAVCFKVLQHLMDLPAYEGRTEDDKAGLGSLCTAVRRFLGGKSDIELQRLLQSSSSVPGLIFTLVGFVAAYATDGDLARLLLGLVGLGSQVVFVTWIYVESWGEFTNSFILTGTLMTAASSTLSPAKCPALECLEQKHSWEPTLIRAMFYLIVATSLLHVILAAAPLLGILKMSPEVLPNRIYKTLDDHFSHMVDRAVHEKSNKFVSESLLSELVKWCMQDKYLGEMQEKVYRGLRRTELRVVMTAVPTLVLAASAIWLKSSWLWGGAAAVALLAASCSAMLLGFFCTRQREHRLPLCFSRAIDIIESFNNASSDLFGMDRKKFDDEKLQIYVDSNGQEKVNAFTKLYEKQRLDWMTCNFMVIQTLGFAELGHFERQWKTESDGKTADGKEYVDPNSNEMLKQIKHIPENVEGLVERRSRIMMALKYRDPVKIGPTAVSKVAGVMMAMQNAIHVMQKHDQVQNQV